MPEISRAGASDGQQLLIKVQDSKAPSQLAMQTTPEPAAPAIEALAESSLSPELPDRKRYALKNKVNLGIYKPSFSMQPDTASLQTQVNVNHRGRGVHRNTEVKSRHTAAVAQDDDPTFAIKSIAILSE